MTLDERFMKEAIRQAKKAEALNEVPIGCVIVYEGRIIARGYNRRNTDKNTLSHAELIAIKKASRKLGDWRLEGCTLYVTLEPCQMCAGAIIQARVTRVVVGSMNPKAGCAGSVLNILQMAAFNHQAELLTGVLGEECGQMLSSFFLRLRRRKKEEKSMNRRWWKEAVVYQIYPRSFKDSNGDGIGDLNGITEKLDYVKELGVDVIWLSPVYQSPNDDNGYDISDYQAIMKDFGTMEDFDRMLAKAHSLGLKIMMDLVVNHTSDEHRWFVESRKNKDNPYRDYYIWRPAGPDGKEPNNWGSAFSGSAWKYDAATDMYFLHLFSKKQPDLNWDNPAVRDEVFSMMDWWCKKGIDGFRMDVISLISKPEGLPDGVAGATGYADSGCANGPHVHEYLQEMNRRVLSKYDLITVGEASGVTVEEAQRYANSQETELNMVFQFEHVGEGTGKPSRFGKWDAEKMPLSDWKGILTKWQKGLEGKAWNSLYLSNHDQPRCVSRFGNDSEQYRVLSAKMLGTCMHMMQGTPYVYEGEELGMTNAYFDSIEDYRDIESINAYHELTEGCGVPKEEMMGYLQRVSRDNARTPMQWDDTENAGFTTGTPWLAVNKNYRTVNAKSQVGDPASVFSYYQRLIRLRHENEIVVYGAYEVLDPENESLFVYTRTLGEEQLLVVCNFTDREQEIPAEAAALLPKEKNVFIGNYPDAPAGAVRPYEAVVYKYRRNA